MKRMLHKAGKKPRTQQPVQPLERQHSRAFLALSVLLVLVFAMGGASRADVASLPVLRPAATAFLFLGLYWLRQEHFKAHSFLLLWGAACAVLVLAQLIPLPPAVWQSLPGRELIVQIGQAAELNDIWRPLTMTPAATRNAFWSLMPPLATLVLAVQLEPSEHKKVLTLIIVLGLTSALLGMLQLLGDPSGPLYFYAVTGNGSAVGLFANRNHQALLLAALLPLLAVWALMRSPGHKRSNSRALIALGAGAFIVPLLLITGSRAGLILGACAVVLACVIIAAARRREPADDALQAPARKSKRKPVGMALLLPLLLSGVAILVTLTIALSRDLAVERLLEQDVGADARAKTLPTTLDMTRHHFVFGSGMGSFEQVYQVHEPDALLGPAYMNHAHNDWLELIMNGGVAALALLVAVLAWTARISAQHISAERISGDIRRLGQAGLSCMILAGLGSVGDYPLRTASLACLMMLALVWIGNMAKGAGRSEALHN